MIAPSAPLETIRFDCVRQQRRCWRCCTVFPVLLAAYELEPYYLYKCGRCGIYRYLPEDEIDRLADAYDCMQLKRTGRQPPHTQKQFNKFLSYFIHHWASPCECGGKYYFASKTPVHCPKCRARSLPGFLWSDDVVKSDPIAKLPYLIPPISEGSPSS